MTTSGPVNPTEPPNPGDPSPFPTNPPVPAAVTLDGEASSRPSSLPRTPEEMYQRIAYLEKMLSQREIEIKNLEQMRADRDKIIKEFEQDKGEAR